jgi:hypothetical protein
MVRCRGFARSKHLNSAGAFVGSGLSRHRGPGRRPHSTPLGVLRGIGRCVHGPRRRAGRPPASSAAPLHWATAVGAALGCRAGPRGVARPALASKAGWVWRSSERHATASHSYLIDDEKVPESPLMAATIVDASSRPPSPARCSHRAAPPAPHRDRYRRRARRPGPGDASPVVGKSTAEIIGYRPGAPLQTAPISF